MIYPDKDYMIVMERRRDELAEAANQRLWNEAKAARRANARQANAPRRTARSRAWLDALMLAFARFLSLTGERMLTWSCRLHTRYELLADGGPEKQPSPCS